MNAPTPPKISYIDLQGFRASGRLLNTKLGMIETPYNTVGYIQFDTITNTWYQTPQPTGVIYS